jgi:hypothetical protein
MAQRGEGCVRLEAQRSGNRICLYVIDIMKIISFKQKGVKAICINILSNQLRGFYLYFVYA